MREAFTIKEHDKFIELVFAEYVNDEVMLNDEILKRFTDVDMIIINLTNTKAILARWWRMLAAMAITAKAQNINVKIAGANDTLFNVARLLGVARHFVWVGALDEAI